jgi:hypothetical protein
MFDHVTTWKRLDAYQDNTKPCPIVFVTKRSTTILLSSSGDPNTPRTAGESIITAGVLDAMATGPEFVGGPPWSLSTTASVLAKEVEDDMVHARLPRKCELADLAVGRQPSVA